MIDKLKTFVGRKLASVILGPVLTALLVAGNAFLPETARLSNDQVTEIVTWILGTIVAFIAAQGAHDVKKGSATKGTTEPPIGS